MLGERALIFLCFTRIHGQDAYGKRGRCRALAGIPAPEVVKGTSGKKDLRFADEAIPPTVPAPGVEIVACGLSSSRRATAARMGPRVTDRLISVWGEIFPEADLTILHSCDLL